MGLWMINSCSCNRPFACFLTSVDEDSIKVWQPVTFTPSCSSGATDYRWEFYDNEDSTSFDYSVTKVFTDSGDVKVFLLVIGDGKVASTSRTIHVHGP